MDFHNVFLAFGSNLGNKKENIEIAYQKIEKQIGEIISKSAFYITKPEDFISNNFFVNSVCLVVTKLSLTETFSITQKIEIEIGRAEKTINGCFADRLIDIDLLMYDSMIVNSIDLTIPHPKFHARSFVLKPFAEIAPDVVHPILNKTISELNNNLQFD